MRAMRAEAALMTLASGVCKGASAMSGEGASSPATELGFEEQLGKGSHQRSHRAACCTQLPHLLRSACSHRTTGGFRLGGRMRRAVMTTTLPHWADEDHASGCDGAALR